MDFIIDPELKYCPQCRDEYRAEIVLCAACGVELLSGQQFLEIEEREKSRTVARAVEISPDDELVDIRSGPVLDIKQLQLFLDQEGFPSLVLGDEGSCGGGCCGANLVLRVRKDDARDVMDLLNREHVQSTCLADHDTSYVDAVFNADAEETTCPACGCRFSTQQATCPDCGLCFA